MPFGILTLNDIVDIGVCAPGWTKLLSALRSAIKLRKDAPLPMDLRVSVGDVALANGGDDAWWLIGIANCVWPSTTECRRSLASALIPCLHRAALMTSYQAILESFAVLEAWSHDAASVDLDAWAASARGTYLAVSHKFGGRGARASGIDPWLSYAAFASLRVARSPMPWQAAREAARAVAVAADFTGGATSRRRERRLQAIDLVVEFPPLVIRPGTRDRIAIQELKGEMGRRQPLPRPSFTPEEIETGCPTRDEEKRS